jgi:PQQ-dependent dehydrogenase (methanol/ethanol family)
MLLTPTTNFVEAAMRQRLVQINDSPDRRGDWMATRKRGLQSAMRAQFGFIVFLTLIGWRLDAQTPANVSATDGTPADTEWPFVDGTPDAWHFGTQTQINDHTVQRLGLAWAASMPSPSGLVGTPLIKGGVVYQSGPGGIVYANDAKTGKSLWKFSPDTQYTDSLSFIAFWAMHHNRGLAVDDAHVYVAAGDCRLFAVDRITGMQAWMHQACDPTQPLGITSAPRLGDGMVFIGNSNADTNTARGFVSAFDATTGKFLWRFDLRPGDPKKPFESETMRMAATTWGDSYWPATVGGAQAWDGMTYDSKLGLLYIGTNGALPDSPLERGKNAGDELFASAIVAVEARTGKYVWHYTEVPHDGWEMSAVAPIQIVELPINGVNTRVIMQAPKNGFFYVLNARTGKFISAGQIAAQNWATGIDPSTGRPLRNPDAGYWNRRGRDTVASPGPNGARSWEPMAYSPKTSLVYVPTRTMATLFRRDGSLDWYYPFQKDAKFKAEGQLIAWDPINQKEKWRVIRPSTHNGGALATAGDLVFQGTVEGAFEALDSRTGRKLWSYQGDGAIMGAASTAMIDGTQFVFVASGDNGASAQTHSAGRFNSTPSTQGPPRLLAFRLDGVASLSPANYPTVKVPKPWRSRQPAALVAQGAKVYDAQVCELCHGVDAIQAGRDIPDLRASSQETYAAMRAILEGAYQSVGMPAFRGISDADLEALQAYLTEQAWNGYEAQHSRIAGSKRNRNAASVPLKIPSQ